MTHDTYDTHNTYDTHGTYAIHNTYDKHYTYDTYDSIHTLYKQDPQHSELLARFPSAQRALAAQQKSIGMNKIMGGRWGEDIWLPHTEEGDIKTEFFGWNHIEKMGETGLQGGRVQGHQGYCRRKGNWKRKRQNNSRMTRDRDSPRGELLVESKFFAGENEIERGRTTGDKGE